MDRLGGYPLQPPKCSRCLARSTRASADGEDGSERVALERRARPADPIDGSMQPHPEASLEAPIDLIGSEARAQSLLASEHRELSFGELCDRSVSSTHEVWYGKLEEGASMQAHGADITRVRRRRRRPVPRRLEPSGTALR